MEELILKAQKGDVEAFTQIVLEYKNELYKIAKSRITNEEDIEDAIQETMIETYKSIKKLKNPQKLKAWLIKILINKCNRIYKRKYKKDISLNENNLQDKLISYNNEKIEDDLDFYTLIKDLRYEERITILLYYMEGYNIKEIKHILRMNENTVRTHLFRGRQKIKINYKGGQKIG